MNDRRHRYCELAIMLMRDAESPWTSDANRALVAIDAAYYVLLSVLPRDVVRNVVDHSCPQLARAGAREPHLSDADITLSEALTRARYAAALNWPGSVVLGWARRLIAVATGGAT